MAFERTHDKRLSGVQIPALKFLLYFAWEHATNIYSIQKRSTLGCGSKRYYELYAVRNKTLVWKCARVDAVLDLDFILQILIMGRLCCSVARYEKVLHCTTLELWLKFHLNPFISFGVIFSINKQTNQRYQKHNLILPRSNLHKHFPVFDINWIKKDTHIIQKFNETFTNGSTRWVVLM